MSTSKGTVQKSSNDETGKLKQVLEGLREARLNIVSNVDYLRDNGHLVGAGKAILSIWQDCIPVKNCECCESCSAISDSVQAQNLLVRALSGIDDITKDFDIIVGNIEEILLGAGGRLGV